MYKRMNNHYGKLIVGTMQVIMPAAVCVCRQPRINILRGQHCLAEKVFNSVYS